MEFVPLAIPDVILIKPRVFSDERGYFFETWRAEQFGDAGIDARFVQENHSHSVRNTIRGLHYQLRQPQGKLVHVVRGSAFDVAVDLRKSSATFGHWVGVELSAENHHLIWIPPGFAHGYAALSDQVDLFYGCTEYWAPADEHSIRWNDPTLNIDWRLSLNARLVLSTKDQTATLFDDAEYFP